MLTPFNKKKKNKIMACPLNIGFQDNCQDKVVGGNEKIFYIFPKNDIISYSEDQDNVITGITFTTGATGYTVYAKEETVNLTEELQLPNRFFLQTLEFQISQLAQATDVEQAAQLASNFLNVLSSADRMTIFTKDSVGVWRVFGKIRGMSTTTMLKTTGAAQADVAGTTVTLTSGEANLAQVVDPSVISAFVLA
jgi:hypothetical protein